MFTKSINWKDALSTITFIQVGETFNTAISVKGFLKRCRRRENYYQMGQYSMAFFVSRSGSSRFLSMGIFKTRVYLFRPSNPSSLKYAICRELRCILRTCCTLPLLELSHACNVLSSVVLHICKTYCCNKWYGNICFCNLWGFSFTYVRNGSYRLLF